MSDYNLIYYCKETGKKFLGKNLPFNLCRILDPETNTTEDFSKMKLRERFKGDKGNKKSNGLINRSRRLR